MNNIDRDFLIWAWIWITWFAMFTALALAGWALAAALLGMISFVVLWWNFCSMMDD